MIGAITSGAPQPAENPRAVKESAEQFEAMLIAQLLKAARDESGGGDTESIREMAEQQLGAVMAKSGGLGLGALIAQGLAPKR